MTDPKSPPKFSDILPTAAMLPLARETIALLASGGDARISLDPQTGLNRYLSAPYPRRTMAFASSTANDLSEAAFAYACKRVGEGLGDYGQALDALRERILAAYELIESSEIVFAASGTDLEYVALAAVQERSPNGIHNVLLGADEVGSGCPLSAHGKYFAEQTSLGVPTQKGMTIPGFEDVSLADIAVRCPEGRARSAEQIANAIEVEVRLARGAGKQALVHIVHGSKTGLILPDLGHLDYLQARWGEDVTFVVDACQARITSRALADYLARGAIVFVTGSKFMGGAPFNGFALLPQQVMDRVGPLNDGLANVFRKGEWPDNWPGSDKLADGANPGLLLRLDAAVFELERFQRLPMREIERVVEVFETAIECELLSPLDVEMVKPWAPGAREHARIHPIEMRTLATIDVSALPGMRTFDDAQAVHRRLAVNGIRLGQPVKCVRLPERAWGGTLRIGLSMPQIVRLAALDDESLGVTLRAEICEIAQALTLKVAA